MIGTLRKHSTWLWYLIIAATIISFVFFWGTSSSRTGGGGGTADLGTVYGKRVTRDAFLSAQADFYLFYFFRTGNWPEGADLKPADIKQGVYQRIMLTQKAEKLGIYVGDDAVATAASARLKALSRNGQAVPLEALVEQVLAPKGFTAADYENFVRHELMLEQLQQTMGLPGTLVTPQEAAAAYQAENEELAAQAVFFNATNYLGLVKSTPEAVSRFYTNYQAEYRVPDRVQINYVVFDLTNYLAQARKELTTNLLKDVETYYRQVGDSYHGAKSALEAKTIITNELVEARAQTDAKKEANALAAAAFELTPVKAENLATAARQKGLVLHETAPFSKNSGPAEFDGLGHFTKVAFELSAESPLSEPVIEGDAIYVMALAQTLPSTIPSFEQLRIQVTADYEAHESTLTAQQAGLAFYRTLTNHLAAGKSFATACVLGGHPPQPLPPFSTSTQELPDLGGRQLMGQLKQAAFTTPLGQPSPFQPTAEGGFILLVQSKLPVDQAKMKADLPAFTEHLRETRQNDAFGQWFQTEASAIKMPKE